MDTVLTIVLRNYPESVVLESSVKPSLLKEDSRTNDFWLGFLVLFYIKMQAWDGSWTYLQALMMTNWWCVFEPRLRIEGGYFTWDVLFEVTSHSIVIDRAWFSACPNAADPWKI